MALQTTQIVKKKEFWLDKYKIKKENVFYESWIVWISFLSFINVFTFTYFAAMGFPVKFQI
jgi:hypothetical protein